MLSLTNPVTIAFNHAEEQCGQKIIEGNFFLACQDSKNNMTQDDSSKK
jgi:hypothetical protein